jgi:hypothetical protein
MISRPQGRSAAGGFDSMKNETVSNRTRDLPDCSAVPSISEMAAIRNGDVMTTLTYTEVVRV